MTKLNLRGILLMLVVLVSVQGMGRCSISVMPMEMQLKAPVAGSRINNYIEVFNPGTTPLHVTASIMDWTSTQSGELLFTPPSTQPRSCASWIQLNPMNFSIAPGQSVRVRYSVTPPQPITQEHWAMIFFQTRPLPAKGGNMAISISTRVGCKMFVVPNQVVLPQGKIADMDVQTIVLSEKKAAMTQASIPGSASATQSSREVSVPSTDGEATSKTGDSSTIKTPRLALTTRVKVVFENTGLTNLRLHGTVEARSADGQLLAQGRITPSKAQILSGAKREFWAQMDKPLLPGSYQFKATVDYGAKELMAGELKARVVAPVNAPTETRN